MRLTTERAVKALKEGKSKTIGNTMVLNFNHNQITELYLFGNRIATYNAQSSTLLITDAGWHSVTTKERLNGILDGFGINGRINQKAGRWYFTYKGDTPVVWAGSKGFAV